MKKAIPYLLGLAALVLLVVLIVIGNNQKPQRKFDPRVTMKEKHKIPYGTSAARTLLPSLFRNTTVYKDNKSPGLWDEINTTASNQAVILVSRDNFNADRYELDRLMSFIEKGNYVFLISRHFSYEARELFNFSYANNTVSEMFQGPQDSLAVQLETPPFSTGEVFVYPGASFESWFDELDTTHTTILGRNGRGQPNFIKLSRGSGALFVHSAPLAFGNYFVLHKNNVRYFENALSVIPEDVEKLVWNEYYLSKTTQGPRPPWYRVLMKEPAFKWGFLVLLATLALHVLLNSRRRQRLIPSRTSPRNDSLDFVKTMGRLYHDRKDHADLSRKMAVYFLEHIRTGYKMPTHTLDGQFVETLHFKSGYPREKIDIIVYFINSLEANDAVSEEQLAGFHRQLEAFYQNT